MGQRALAPVRTRSTGYIQPEPSAHLRLYDIGQQGDIDYLVMEYLEGETLAQRLQRGPLSIPEVVEIGIAVATALDMLVVRGKFSCSLLLPRSDFAGESGQQAFISAIAIRAWHDQPIPVGRYRLNSSQCRSLLLENTGVGRKVWPSHRACSADTEGHQKSTVL